MKRTVIALSALVLAISAATVVAQENPIEARKALMKSNGQAMGVIGPMAKGEKEFDAAAASAALEQIHQNAQDFDVEALFPEGSDEGDTRADPKIWAEFEEFKQYAEEWETASAAAVESNPQNAEELQALMGSIGQNCGTCHEGFRQPEE